MKPSEVGAVLDRLVGGRRSVFLWGPPGIGKSDAVKQFGVRKKREVIDIRAVTLDPVDIRGLPHINGDGRAHWCPPSFLPHDPNSTAILFLDEIAQAPALVQSACLQLCLDGRIGEWEMPKGCSIIAASNRQTDRAGSHKIISSLANRFIHIDMEVSKDDWMIWAAGAGIDPAIMGFLNFRTNLLHDFDPSKAANAFATPRSWHALSESLALIGKTLPSGVLHEVVQGHVGDGPAAEFMSFLKIYHGLPDPDKVLAAAEEYEVPSEPSVQWALCAALIDRLRHNKKVLKPFFTFAQRMPKEFEFYMIIAGNAASDGALVKLPEFRKWSSVEDNKRALLPDYVASTK